MRRRGMHPALALAPAHAWVLAPARAWVLALATLLLLAALPSPAHAHKASDAYLRLQAEGAALTLRADIALRDLDRDLVLDADDDGQLRWGEVRQRSADIQALLDAGLQLAVSDRGGAACTAQPVAPLQIDEHSDGRYAVLQRRWQCATAPARAELAYRLFAATDPSHRGVLVLRSGSELRTEVLAPGGAPLALALAAAPGPGASAAAGPAPRPPATGLASIFIDGAQHIGVGIDHVLFLLVLLLPAVLVRQDGRWQPAPDGRRALLEVVGIVTAFTVAHSITLALAAFGLLEPPPRLVEALIALSVLLAALNNLRPVVVAARWRLTFGFGLIHGFGFASALRDLGLARGELVLPLLAFNLGVEAGQLLIVALLVPLAWALRRWSGYPRWVLGSGSLLVALLALAWLVERTWT